MRTMKEQEVEEVIGFVCLFPYSFTPAQYLSRILNGECVDA